MQPRQNESSNTKPTVLTLRVDVDVDLDTKLMRVRGTDVDEAAVVSASSEAGYDAVVA